MLISDRLKVLRELSMFGTMGDEPSPSACNFFLFIRESNTFRRGTEPKATYNKLNLKQCDMSNGHLDSMPSPEHPLSKGLINLVVSDAFKWPAVTKSKRNERTATDVEKLDS